jgi:hypothetical protein
MREEMRKGFVVLTRADCESIEENVMKNRVGNKERLFETSRKGDLVSRPIYISQKTENLWDPFLLGHNIHSQTIRNKS